MIGRGVVVAGAVAGATLASPDVGVAETWRGTAEAGLEYDSNVERVEAQRDPQAAPMLRARAGADVRGGRARRVRWSLAFTGGARAAVAPSTGNTS